MIKPRVYVTPEWMAEIGFPDWAISSYESWLYRRGVRRAKVSSDLLEEFDQYGGLEELFEMAALGELYIPRSATLDIPEAAYLYAQKVDKKPSDETRAAACEDPVTAYLYARHVDKGPHDDTRAAASLDPRCSLEYAVEIDGGPHPLTRAGACRNPRRALEYAQTVDKGPHPLTRTEACRNTHCALEYARTVDKGPHPETFAAVVYYPRLLCKYPSTTQGDPDE